MINTDKLYTPEVMPNNDMRDVAECMGVDVAVELMENFGGQDIYIPKKPQTAIVKKYAEANPKKTVSEIARDLNLSRRTVYRNL